MTADLISDLIAANLAIVAAILLILAARNPLRRAMGSRAVYAAWLVVPMAALAIFLPSPPEWLALFAPQPVAAGFRAGPVQAPSFDWSRVILWLWLGGAGAGLLAVALVHQRALRKLGLERPAGGGPLRTAAKVSGPAVIGVIASRIVLPADFEDRFSPPEQAVILAHEQRHLAVGDVRINAALVLFACLFWFNPLVHLAARLVRVDQELACDEAVIARHPQARRTYAEALLKTQLSSSSLPLGCYWPERSHKALKERLNMLTLKSPGRGRRIAGAALLCALGLGTGYVAWAAAPQEPPLVDEKVDTLLPIAGQGTIEDDGQGNVLRTYPLGHALTNSGARQADRTAPIAGDRPTLVRVPEGLVRGSQHEGYETFYATGLNQAQAMARNPDGSVSPTRMEGFERVESLRFTAIPPPGPNQGFGASRLVDEKVDTLLPLPGESQDLTGPYPLPAPAR